MNQVDAADIWALMVNNMGFYARVAHDPDNEEGPYVDIWMSEEDAKASPSYLSAMMWYTGESGVWEVSYDMMLAEQRKKIDMHDPYAGTKLRDALIEVLKVSRLRYLDTIKEAEVHMEQINRKLRKFR